MIIPVTVVGVFVPSEFNYNTIRDEFARFMQVYPDQCEVRAPYYHDTIKGMGWHKDANLFRGYIWLWASESPTLVRYKAPFVDSWVQFQAQPFEVVKIDNAACEHKPPAEMGDNRWLVRYMNLFSGDGYGQ